MTYAALTRRIQATLDRRPADRLMTYTAFGTAVHDQIERQYIESGRTSYVAADDENKTFWSYSLTKFDPSTS